jgi:hypothetical protein
LEGYFSHITVVLILTNRVCTLSDGNSIIYCIKASGFLWGIKPYDIGFGEILLTRIKRKGIFWQIEGPRIEFGQKLKLEI